MSHFTPGKTGVDMSSPLSPAVFLASWKNIAWWDFWEHELERWALNSNSEPELLSGSQWHPPLHILLLFVWSAVQINCAIVLLNSLFNDQVLCWKTSSVKAWVDSGAFTHQAPSLRGDFMGCPNLAETGTHKKRCREGGCKAVYQEMPPSSVFPDVTKYSCLAQILLKINHLQRFCFAQYSSLQPLLHARACTRTCPLQVFFLPRTPPAKKH